MESTSHVIFFRNGQPMLAPAVSCGQQKVCTVKDECWEIICTITMWQIWKARCQKVFQDVTIPPAEIVAAIWEDIIHTLKGQYGAIKGGLETTEHCRLKFRLYKERYDFFTCNNVHTHLFEICYTKMAISTAYYMAII